MEIKKQICCVSEYLLAINELNETYTTQGMANIPTASKFIYRGISDDGYKLLPSILRNSHDIDITINDYIVNNMYTAYSTEDEITILRTFIAEACAYINDDPTKDMYKWAEYAQHYGAPTRFLDWTENPLVALYFACRNGKPDYKSNSKNDNDIHIGGKNAKVWMLHIHNYSNYANQVDNVIYSSDRKMKYTVADTINKVYEKEVFFEFPIVYKPYYTDLRMSAQSSMFMVWGQKEEPLDEFFTEANELRSNMNKNGGRAWSKKQFHEIVFDFHIHATAKQSILRELDTCGINEKTLFPGLDGIGRYVEAKHRFDLEEAKWCF